MVLGKKRGRFPGAEPLSSLHARRGRVPPKPVPLLRRIPFPLLRAFLLGAVAPIAVAWAIARSHARAEERARPFATASEFAGSGVARDGGPTRTGARPFATGARSSKAPELPRATSEPAAAQGAPESTGEVFYDVDTLLDVLGADAGKP